MSCADSAAEPDPVVMTSPSVMEGLTMNGRKHRPLNFRNVKGAAEGFKNMLVHYAFPHLHCLQKDYTFTRIELLGTTQTESQVI